MDVSIVITCWNGRGLLEKNLPKVIEASKSKENLIKEIIVVDDGSTDGSVDFLCEKYPQVRVIKQEKNYGYSSTCNRGVKDAKGELVAILNLDVIPSKNFLVSSVLKFDNKSVFAVSFNEGHFGPGKIVWKSGFMEIIPREPVKEVVAADWASGGSSVFRKQYWMELGGMDKIYLPFYFEDIDLGLKAKKRGYLCLWDPESKVEHRHESTINPNNFKKEYIQRIKERNHLLLTWKNINNPLMAITHLYFLGKRCLFSPGYIKIVFLALFRIINN